MKHHLQLLLPVTIVAVFAGSLLAQSPPLAGGVATTGGARAFGAAIEPFGADVTGNGFFDIAVASPAASGGGRVDVGDFPPGGVFTVVATISPGTLPSSTLFGWSLAADMDLDGDGVNDLVVGVPGLDLGGGVTGGVVAYSMGATATPTFLWVAAPPAPYSNITPNFGFSVAMIPDTDNDGGAEVVVGDSASGVVYVRDGSSGLALGPPTGQPFGPGSISMGPPAVAGQGWGFAVAGSPTSFLFGPGTDSAFAMSSPETDEVAVVNARTMSIWLQAPITPTPGGQSELAGYSIDFIGDHNSDGVEDIVIGEPLGSTVGGVTGKIYLWDYMGHTVIPIDPVGANALSAGTTFNSVTNNGAYGFQVRRVTNPSPGNLPLIAVGAFRGALDISNPIIGGYAEVLDVSGAFNPVLPPATQFVATVVVSAASGGSTVEQNGGDRFGAAVADGNGLFGGSILAGGAPGFFVGGIQNAGAIGLY